TDRPCYEVEFSDGTVIVADAQHQWRTITRAARRQRRAFSWPSVSPDRVHRAASAGTDGLVTRRGALAVVGASHTVGEAGTAHRPVGGPARGCAWNTPARSRRRSFGARMCRPESP